MAKNFVAVVKSVLSGDTLVLASPSNPSLERTFSLAYVTAPRLSKDGDEPFAFQSREFLRNLAVGKQIKCVVLCKFSPPDPPRLVLLLPFYPCSLESKIPSPARVGNTEALFSKTEPSSPTLW